MKKTDFFPVKMTCDKMVFFFHKQFKIKLIFFIHVTKRNQVSHKKNHGAVHKEQKMKFATIIEKKMKFII